MRPTHLFVLKGYPRLSETFIAQEILALERRGLALALASLRRPTDARVHPVHRDIRAAVNYLPEYLYREPARVFRAWRHWRRRASYARARAVWLADLAREPTTHRGRRFGQALVLAAELPPSVRHLHAHFLHTPASVVRYTALLTGLPWSASAHARDIWTTPDWDLREKLAAAEWVVTCTESGRRRLAGLAPAPERVGLVYHGLDFRRFAPPPPRLGNARDGSDAAQPVVILSVGRAVPKKGYGDLLKALARLPASLSWRFVHVGGGVLSKTLRRQAARLGLAGRIEWLGAEPQDAVLLRYRAADLFVLASRIAKDGDRDGLPNVLMEAQSQGLAVIATAVSGVPELIVDGTTGVLVPEGQPEWLAGALAALIADPARRGALGQAGLERARAHFDMTAGIDALARRFGLVPAATEEAPCPSLSMRP